jgi:hypothetical protein
MEEEANLNHEDEEDDDDDEQEWTSPASSMESMDMHKSRF